MRDTPDERWESLCEKAANEQDSAKLIKLIKEINDLLEEKRRTGKNVDNRQADSGNTGRLDERCNG